MLARILCSVAAAVKSNACREEMRASLSAGPMILGSRRACSKLCLRRGPRMAPDAMRRWQYGLRTDWRVLTAAIVTAPLAACAGGVLDPRGPSAAANRQIMLNALGIMLVIVVPTILAALAFAWWFRADNTRARYQPGWVYSG